MVHRMVGLDQLDGTALRVLGPQAGFIAGRQLRRLCTMSRFKELQEDIRYALARTVLCRQGQGFAPEQVHPVLAEFALQDLAPHAHPEHGG